MSDELKTLQEDFKEIYESFNHEMDTYDDELRVQEMIQHVLNKTKQKAIKWVKSGESKKGESIYLSRETIVWIKNFFNITEEELK